MCRSPRAAYRAVPGASFLSFGRLSSSSWALWNSGLGPRIGTRCAIELASNSSSGRPRGGERHGRHRNDRADAAEHLTPQALQLGEALLFREGERVPRGALEPGAQRLRRPKVDRHAAITLEPAGQQAQGIAGEIRHDRAEL